MPLPAPVMNATFPMNSLFVPLLMLLPSWFSPYATRLTCCQPLASTNSDTQGMKSKAMRNQYGSVQTITDPRSALVGRTVVTPDQCESGYPGAPRWGSCSAA
jgi:hypothetical protein